MHIVSPVTIEAIDPADIKAIILNFLLLVVTVFKSKCVGVWVAVFVCVSGHVCLVENHVAYLLPVVATDVQ